MFVPLLLLFFFIPIVYALGCSIKTSVRMERIVPASVTKLHKFLKKREKLSDFNPNIEKEVISEETESEEKSVVVYRLPFFWFWKPKYEMHLLLRHLDTPESESIDITMEPIGVFELFYHFEQAITYERVSEDETLMRSEFTITVPRVLSPAAMLIVKDAEKAVVDKIVAHFEAKQKAKAQISSQTST